MPIVNMGSETAAGSRRTLERKYLLARVHNGRVGSDGSPEDIVALAQIDDDDLVLFVDLFANANEAVGLERQRLCVRCCEPLLRDTTNDASHALRRKWKRAGRRRSRAEGARRTQSAFVRP
jgi:hypothetical protein